MTIAKGRKNLTGRRGFVALGLAVLGLPWVARAAGESPPSPRTKPATAKPPSQRARLPRRLAADFHGHIDTRLPHLRTPFENAARATGLPWRVLAALGYQESRWRPAAVSPRGAQGVMMLMPVTAKKMGVSNVFSPDENILAGARYLAYMKERIPQRILDPDRTWMAMAAYNIGIGHLEDARIITQMRKKDPDRWAEVRVNLPRLADPHWHSRVKRGYANGNETVQFVERVAQFAAILESSVPETEVVQALPRGG
ncbi:MAG TPA: transglycosylase SLT domain-containing protein [Steroidobacteraceae bacterium]|jgi:peptidoglycan lytic transglycosylase F|nr:transglycosylase SLT domain-containing protein [Steroidobacteraceae bacterium]